MNSDPANWPIILNWLSFGAVPDKPTASLLSECRYWQLDELLAAIDGKSASASKFAIPSRMACGCASAAEDCHHFTVKAVTIDGKSGFTATGEIIHFPTHNACSFGPTVKGADGATGSSWLVLADEFWAGFFPPVYALRAPLTIRLLKIECGSGDRKVVKTATNECELKEKGMMFGWAAGVGGQLMHPRMLTVEGSLLLTVTATFKH